MRTWLSLFAVCAAGVGLAALPEEGTTWTIGVGETETVTAESTLTTLTGLQDNGTLTIAKDLTVNAGGAYVHAVGNGADVNASLTIAAGKTLTVVGNSTATPPANTAAFAIGMMGGTGTVTVESGASLLIQNAVLDIGRNEDAHRELSSAGTLNIYGTVTTRSLECCAWFPTIDTAELPNYDIENFPVVATINLEEGGVLSSERFVCNDQAATVVNFKGGTLRATKTDAAYVGSAINGVMRWNIAAGKNLIFDTQAFHCKFSGSAKRTDFFTLAGEGGLVKRGSGYLQIAMPPESNTFTGPIVVEEGFLSLGRPLAEGQTVLVKSGAEFYPARRRTSRRSPTRILPPRRRRVRSSWWRDRSSADSTCSAWRRPTAPTRSVPPSGGRGRAAFPAPSPTPRPPWRIPSSSSASPPRPRCS